MSDESDEKEDARDRYRKIDLLDQLVKLLVATGGDERVLIFQLDIWQKQAHVIVPMAMIEEAQDRATTVRFLRDLSTIDGLDETLPVRIRPSQPSTEDELRSVVEEVVPAAGG